MDKLTDEELNAYAAHAFDKQDLPLMAMVMELQNARITLAQHGAFLARAEWPADADRNATGRAAAVSAVMRLYYAEDGIAIFTGIIGTCCRSCSPWIT